VLPNGMAESDADVVVVLSTVPASDSAEKIARALVAEQLAACVNLITGVRSFYEWDGSIADQEEYLAVIKTTRARVPAILKRLPEIHPYDLPEALVVPVTDGHPPYLAWIAQMSKGS
jgi:periplasmic divalent cation tolerance protein